MKRSKRNISVCLAFVLLVAGCGTQTEFDAAPAEQTVSEGAVAEHSVEVQKDASDNQETPESPEPAATDTLHIFQENGLYGFTDAYGEIVVEAVFDEAQLLQEDIGLIRSGGLWGHVTEKGVVVEPQFDEPYTFHDGSVFDTEKIKSIGPDAMLVESDGSPEEQIVAAIVSLGDRTGIIDTNGDFIIPLQQFSFGEQVEDITVFNLPESEGCGLVSASGYIALLDYDRIEDFHLGMAVVERDGQKGAVDQTGWTLIPPEKEKIGMGSYRIAPYRRTGGEAKYGYVNEAGEVILEPVYDYLSSEPADGRIVAKQDGLFGAFDLRGNSIIPLQYTYLDDYSDGLALFSEDGGLHFGYVDTSGNQVVPAVYGHITAFYEGVALAYPNYIKAYAEDNPQNPGKPVHFLWSYAYIDREGNELYRSDILYTGGSLPVPEGAMWRIYDVPATSPVEIDINGYYGHTQDGEYYDVAYGNHTWSGWWGEFNGAPVYEAMEWDDDAGFREVTSEALLSGIY